MESKIEQPRPVKKQKKNKKDTKGFLKLVLPVLVFLAILVAIILLGKYLSNRGETILNSKDIHEDVSLNSKEKSYYDLLLATMNKHEELVSGAKNVYFNLYDLPGLTHDEKENVAKKVLHSFAIHKDKELLMDTFDGLFFRGILNQETSELKDGIYVTFEDLKKDSTKLDKQFAISIYKTSNLNPKIIYNVTLDKNQQIVSSKLVSDLLPHENVEKAEKTIKTTEKDDNDEKESVEE